MFPQKIFVPAHAPVGSGFVALGAEAASVHHHHRHVRIGAFGNLVLHVHLVDGDVSGVEARAEESRARPCERVGENRVSADEEAALLLQDQRIGHGGYRGGEKQNRQDCEDNRRAGEALKAALVFHRDLLRRAFRMGQKYHALYLQAKKGFLRANTMNGLRKNLKRCHSERSEESLRGFLLALKSKRDSSLRSE